MGRDFFTMDDFVLAGSTVLLRVDINSPIDPATGRLLNDARIREHLATIRDLREARVAILAHQSRPGKDDFTTMESHAERMAALLGRPVRYVDSLFGKSAIDAVQGMRPGDVVLLENTRFFAEEEALADAKFEKMAKAMMVRKLAPLAQYFVLDAFAAAHRAQPSLCGFAEVMPALAGRVMEREITMVSRAMESQERPKLAIFGGIKADDSTAVTRHMLTNGVVDKVLTAGGVANLFLAAKGIDPGAATTEFMRKEIENYDGYVASCKELLAKFPGRIEIPIDVAVNDGGTRRNLHLSELPSKHQVYDIGLDTIVHYQNEIDLARTIILNGPAGVFELEEFSLGTREVFAAVANAAAFKVVGGGHTVTVVEEMGLRRKIDHVSTGGGALINFLAGKELPLITALKRSHAKFSKAK
ncbi:MAG TPA: phosphoglycerate kinase [Thermoplasmata archaeon]|nr:phosphoglycerate kinase [Thermoplasmata archaeon]